MCWENQQSGNSSESPLYRRGHGKGATAVCRQRFCVVSILPEARVQVKEPLPLPAAFPKAPSPGSLIEEGRGWAWGGGGITTVRQREVHPELLDDL